MKLTAYRSAVSGKLFLLYALNLADWVCTVTLLGADGFYEANPLLRALIGSPVLGMTIKGVLPAMVLAAVGQLLRLLDSRAIGKVDRCLCFVLTVYTALCANHIANFVILFFHSGA